jgi:diadenosine tetraphosphatase ApaH/serine/threonine PP2A family protein phosphatase
LFDVHGNVRALDAVLAELEGIDVDAIVLGGDHVGGPWPAETLDRLRSIAGDVRWIVGNGEREIVPGQEGLAPASIVEFVRGALSPDDVEELAGAPLTVTLDVDGLGPVLFCHATPRSDVEIRTAISPDARWLEVLDGVDEPVVVCGHTHVQFERTIGSKRVVNAGSVGMPYEDEPGAYWLLLGPTVEFRHTPYDVAATLAAIEASDFPDEWPQASREDATAYFESLVDA